MARTPLAGAAALLALACAAAQAQDVSSSPSGTPTGSGDAPGAPDRVPFYVGVSEALTHTSNVYRTDDAKAGWYSTTSLFGGATAHFGRQRVYGIGNVGVDRYFDESRQNNVHYGLVGGLDWETVARLSGNVEAGADRSATAPPVGDDDSGAKKKRTQTAERINGVVRWGGDSAINVELRGGASKVDYSGSGSGVGDNTSNSVSLGVFYRPGTKLRVGVALRQNRTRTDDAFVDTTSGEYESNTVRSRNVDLLVDYATGSNLTVGARLSYTRQDNSNGAVDSDFSGLTGSLNVGYRLSGKTSASFYAARDAGTNGTPISYPVTTITNVTNPDGTTTPVITTTPGSVLYQSTQRTTTVGAGVSYAATAKIGADAGANYTRQRVLQGLSGAGTDTAIDRRTSFYIGASYAFARNWDSGCRYTYEKRDLSSGAGDDYHVHAVSCRVAYTIR